MNKQSNQSDTFFKILSIILVAVTLYSCMANLDRQAEADYQECLSWQADGHDIRCNKETYR